MRILVTSGAGFIGSHYVRTLTAGGYTGFEDMRVTVLDKLTYAGHMANFQSAAGSPRCHFVHRDICDPACSHSDPNIVHRPLPGSDCRTARYQEDKQ